MSNPAVIYLLTIDRPNGTSWAYCGKHCVTPEALRSWPESGAGPLPSGYCGSGFVWARALKKYGTSAIRWRILGRYATEEEAFAAERETWVPWARLTYGRMCTNRAEGGEGWTSDEGRRCGATGGATGGKITGPVNGRRLHELSIGCFGLTPEQARARNQKGGKLIGKRTFELGIGVHALTTEERREYAKIGGRRARELGIGIHGLTTEERREYARKGATASAEWARLNPEKAKAKARLCHLTIARKRHALGQSLTPKQCELLLGINEL